MKQLKDIVLERLILSKTKKYLSEEDLLKTKKGNKLGTFSIKNDMGDAIYLYYYSLILNDKDVAYLEDWSDDVFGERWQIIIIPNELFDSLNLEEDNNNDGSFIVPENIRNHIINIFEFDDEENIDIMSASLWFSLRDDKTYYGSNKQYMSFIKKIKDNL